VSYQVRAARGTCIDFSGRSPEPTVGVYDTPLQTARGVGKILVLILWKQ